jgi:hypothetical protein
MELLQSKKAPRQTVHNQILGDGFLSERMPREPELVQSGSNLLDGVEP